MRTEYYYFGEIREHHTLALAKKIQENLLKDNWKGYIEKNNPTIYILSGDTGEILAIGTFIIEDYTFDTLMVWNLL